MGNLCGGKPSNDTKYLTFFIGDNTRSQLNERNTHKFETSFFEHAFSSKAKKALAYSIRKACYLYTKKDTELEHRLISKLEELRAAEINPLTQRKKRKGRGTKFTHIKGLLAGKAPEDGLIHLPSNAESVMKNFFDFNGVQTESEKDSDTDNQSDSESELHSDTETVS